MTGGRGPEKAIIRGVGDIVDFVFIDTITREQTTYTPPAHDYPSIRNIYNESFVCPDHYINFYKISDIDAYIPYNHDDSGVNSFLREDGYISEVYIIGDSVYYCVADDLTYRSISYIDQALYKVKLDGTGWEQISE